MTNRNRDNFDSGIKCYLDLNHIPEGSYVNVEYLNAVKQQLDVLIGELNGKFISKGAKRTPASILQGNFAEYFLAETFNLDAIAAGSSYRAKVLGSNKLGSVDIVIYKVDANGNSIPNTEIEYSLKYNKSGKKAATEQTQRYYDRYMKFLKEKNLTTEEYSFEKFLQDKKLDPDDIDEYTLLYRNQIRIVPKGKLTSVRKAIAKKMQETTDIREKENLQLVLDLLDDALRSPNGDVQSVFLTRSQAEKLVKSAQKGKIDIKRLGLDFDAIFSNKRILKQALKAGKMAAILTFVCQIAPGIISIFHDMFLKGYVDFENLNSDFLSESSSAFMQGVITAAITTKISVEFLKHSVEISPDIIALGVFLCYDIIVTSIKCYKNGDSNKIIAVKCMNNMLIGLSAYAGMKFGTFTAVRMSTFALLGIGFPSIAVILGSLIGAAIAGLTTQLLMDKCLSICIENDYTFWGLVEQDYTLPEGYKYFLINDYIAFDRLQRDAINNDCIRSEKIQNDTIQFDSILSLILQRNVVGVQKIGYICRNYSLISN